MGGHHSKPPLSQPTNSFKERQDALKKSIAGAFASQVVKKSLDVSFTAISFAGIDCNTQLTKDCKTCLQKYYSEKWLDNPNNKLKVKKLMEQDCKNHCVDACEFCLLTNLPRSISPGSNNPKVKEYKQTFCRNVCTCSLKNINNSSRVTLNSIVRQQIQNVDVKAIAAQVEKDMEDKYGSSGAMNPADLISLLVTIKYKMVTSIKQTLHSTQALVVKGPGVDLSDVIQNVIINATMQAITATCSEKSQDPNNPGFQSSSVGGLPPPSSNCNIDMLNTLVNQQLQTIVDEVDRSVKFNLQTVWNNSKRYVILTCLFVVFIFIVIVVLLIKNAIRKAV